MTRHADEILGALGLEDELSGAHGGRWLTPSGPVLETRTPIDGSVIATVRTATAEDYEQVAGAATEAFAMWRDTPAPVRGQLVREIAETLREHKEELGRLVTLETGKVLSEGEGEVQEMIDIADFAVGLSRQLYGKTMHSERPDHRMYEQWHPFGPVGVVTAFNFPVAVWAWNALVAAVCGDTVVWKPSSKAPLSAVAVQRLVAPIAEAHGVPGLFGLVIGSGSVVGERLVGDRRLPLISATGSVRMGRRIGEVVAERLGRSILELGGNNGLVVLDDADPELALRAILFGAVGTAGQRCTTTRRAIVQKGIASELVKRLVEAYGKVRVGDPLDPGTLMGPLVDADAVDDMMAAVDAARQQGGEVLCGGRRLAGDRYPGGCWVEPTIIRARASMPILQQETFAPILYVVEVDDLDEAIASNNGVPQGLSSAVFTGRLAAAERFLSHGGSDCGIANVNIGTSGAEIGGAFGGEKETGGGREAGSDSWKAYMRRQTTTINFGPDLPLAQGVTFEL